MTSHLMNGASNGQGFWAILVAHKRTIIAVTSGIGIGMTVAFAIKGLFSISRKSLPRIEPEQNDIEYFSPPPAQAQSETRSKVRTVSSEDRPHRQSLRQKSSSMNPIDADVLNGYEYCSEILRTMERVSSNLTMIKNRSEKDKQRSDKIERIIEELRAIEKSFSEIIPSGDDISSEVVGLHSAESFYTIPSVRTGTLSVLSDDSFISAAEDFIGEVDDVDYDNEASELHENDLVFLQEGLEAAMNGKVQYRKSRAEFCQCESETDFAAKLYCVRLALDEIFKDERKKVWMIKCSRSLLADYIRHTKQSPAKFFAAFDAMIEFLGKDGNAEMLTEEVQHRGVIQSGFFDVVIDFVLLDSFDDLRNPPSAIYSVTKNSFMSQSMQYSTLNTIIWSMLKAKRQRLKNPDGFIYKFYDISEAIMPPIILGFLGTNASLGELCKHFKDQITQFLLDIFNTQKVRYRSVDELAEDIWIVMRQRIESVQTRMSTELLPA